MDAFDSPHSFYPAALADYDVTLHPHAGGGGASSGFNALDNNLNIDLESFAGSDIPSLLHRKHVSHQTFEDAFSDVNSAYDQHFASELPPQDAKTPPLDSEDNLLKFHQPTFHYSLLEYTYGAATVSLEAQLNGMFFSSMAETPSGADDGPAPKSVTCYRRNLFSVVGSISLPRSLRYIATEHGEQLPIIATEAALTATESMEGASVKLISVPFKSASMPPGLDEKADKDPPNIPIDLLSGSEVDSSFATFPLVWKRLQFRSSTANNGRRKELQQNYICRVSLIATLSTGQRVSLCDIASEPIVVRGRSPRAFAAKKEAPTSMTGIYPPGRKPTLPRSVTTDTLGRISAVKSETEYNFDFNELGINSDAWGMSTKGHQGALTSMPADFRISPHDLFAQSSPDMSRYPPQVNVPAPVSLSLIDEDVKKPSPAPGRDPPRKTPRLNSAGRPPSFSLGSAPSNGHDDELDDTLYEFFPLGLDEWQEPVEAVYRPHVVHHISTPAATKDMSKVRSKRYFSDASPP